MGVEKPHVNHIPGEQIRRWQSHMQPERLDVSDVHENTLLWWMCYRCVIVWQCSCVTWKARCRYRLPKFIFKIFNICNLPFYKLQESIRILKKRYSFGTFWDMAVQVRDIMSNLWDLTFLQVCWYTDHHPLMSSTRLDANSHVDHSDTQ